MTRAATRRDGFTLLEVLVAVAVLGLALVSLLGLHVRNLAQQNGSDVARAPMAPACR